MTAVPPALPGTAQNKRLKESHELTRLLLGKADMRVVRSNQMIQRVRVRPRQARGVETADGDHLFDPEYYAGGRQV